MSPIDQAHSDAFKLESDPIKAEKVRRKSWKEEVISLPAGDAVRPVINHVGISGGKDSTALLLWAVHESGYDKSAINATFCDTGNEHQITYDFIAMLSEKVHPIVTIKPPLDFYELSKHKKRFPGVKSRFCTVELKVKPSKKHVRELIEQGFNVVMHSGVRASESFERSKLMKREEISEYITEFRPLLSWSIEDIWAIHKRYGIEPNPLYAMGAKRVGCLPCIMSRKAEIANIATRFPETIEKISKQEHQVGDTFHGFFCRNKVPKRFRSRKIIASNGKMMTVCTVEDVVEWATEPARKEAMQRQLFEELDTRAEDRTSCQSTWGSCE